MVAGHVHAADRRWRWDQAAPLRWLLVDEFTMGEPDTVVALCSEIDGLFAGSSAASSAGRPAASGSPDLAASEARLIGCRAEQPLRVALDALAQGAGAPGGALWRRRVSASIYSVAEDGATVCVPGSGGLHASVTAAGPSLLGDGLLDISFDAAITGPLPFGASQIWDIWRAGRPSGPGRWAGYDSVLRHEWSGAALAHHRPGPADRPAGTTYHLDGLDVTDLAGFYCAIGEAVNGPGGYFGWNGDALHDCLRGGWGAARPFRLVWHDAAVAREHLAGAFDQVLEWLTEDGVEVELR